MDQPSLSDHRYILFEIASDCATEDVRPKLDKECLKATIQHEVFPVPELLSTSQDIDNYVTIIADKLQEIVTQSTDVSCGKRHTISWWTPELEHFKADIVWSHRLFSRSKNPLAKEIHREYSYWYHDETKKAKLAAWKKLISPYDTWGKPYCLLKLSPLARRFQLCKNPSALCLLHQLEMWYC